MIDARLIRIVTIAIAVPFAIAIDLPAASRSGGFDWMATAHADDDGGGGGGGGGAGGGGGGPGGEGGGESRSFLAGRQTRITLPFGSIRLGWPFQPSRQHRVVRPRAPRQAALAGTTAPRRELVIVDVSGSQIEAIRADGFRVIAARALSAGRGTILRLAPPSRTSPDRALARLNSLAPGAPADRNTIYTQRFRVQSGKPSSRKAFADPLAAVDRPPDRACGGFGTIGVIDTGVDTDHPGLSGKALETIVVRAPDRRASGRRHGTAIVTLLLGDTVFSGVAASVRVVAVDAFHARGDGDQIDTFDLVSAIDLLGSRKVSVINLSLTGDANTALDAEGRRARQKGIVVATAVGNDGAAARPRYPAAYEWALAVSAIDEDRDIYRRAVRGPHVKFAAPGVNLELRDSSGRVRQYTGTSFAVPFVAARLALQEPEQRAQMSSAPTSQKPSTEGAGPAAAVDRIETVAKQALDLGPVGRDDQFGHGLVQFGKACGG